MKGKTIVAISTPIGRGGISIVRMSGPKSLEIARGMCSVIDFTPRMLYLSKLKFSYITEKCLTVYFKAPFSFTGEDIVEFQIHGGEILTQKVLEECINRGAELAEPGEFSKLAFLNGKIGMGEAEIITNIINASCEAELRAGMTLARSGLYKHVEEHQKIIRELLAKIDVSFDYPENEEEFEVKEELLNEISEILSEIEELLQNDSKFIRTGVSVAIIGRPNVGKSSLLNALLGEDRAIVTEVPGTTRDSLIETRLFNGIKINFADTAGIHETEDPIEKLGIKKSKNLIEESDIILLLLDGSDKLLNEDKVIMELTKNKNRIVVINKADKQRSLKGTIGDVEISAKTGKNIDKLLKKIISKVIGKNIDYNASVVLNERVVGILKESKKLCIEIKQNSGDTLDLLETKLKRLYILLGKITGKTENEDIVDLIFSKFCLGK